MDNYYEILEVNEKASKETISKVFKMHIKVNHPDLFKGEQKLEAEEKLKKINEAYEVLSNDEKRAEYDKKISEEKNSIQEQLEKKIEFLEEQVKRKQEVINNIGLKLGVVLPNEDNYINRVNSNKHEYEKDLTSPDEGYEDENNTNTRGVTGSYFDDIKAFFKKIIIIFIGFILFCLGTWAITGINILKDIIQKIITGKF